MAKKIKYVIFVSILSIGIFFAPGKNLLAEDHNWVTSNDLRFEQTQSNLLVTQLPQTISTKNIDCYKRDLVIKPASLFFLVAEQRISVCANDTSAGIYGNGYLQANGTNVAGPLKLRVNSESLITANNTTSFIILNNSAPTGSYVYFLRNLQVDTTVNLDKSVNHKISNPNDVKTIYGQGTNRLTAIYDTISFSGNGRWAVFDSPYHGQVRMNMDDGSILSFGEPIDYGVYNPFYKTAISADGRFAIFSSTDFSIIYDLSNCSNRTDKPHLKRCPSKQLNTERLAKTNNWGRSMNVIRFINDRSFSYYSGQSVSGVTTYKQFRVSVGDVPKFGMNYLGLGDSFASGEGSYNYKPLTDLSDNECHVSLSAYQFLIGSQLNKDKYNSVACSGAKAEDIFSDIDSYQGQYGEKIFQKDRKDQDYLLGSFTPGKITQHTFVQQLSPEAVTISIGGNDIGFSEKIKACVYKDLDGTCFNTFEDRAEIMMEIQNVIADIENTYRNLKLNNNRVYAIGYPKLVGENGNCASNVKLNNSEADFANKLVELLNSGIKTAAKRAGVVYVEVENILNGHRLCETDSADVFVHGITEGISKYQTGDKFHVVAKESFHPKAQAQQLFANSIINQTDNLTKPMPAEDTAAELNIPPQSDNYWQVEKTNRSLFMPRYQSLMLDAVEYRNSQIRIQLPKNITGLKPNSSVRVEIHSKPIDLGNFVTDSGGNLDLQITIPETISSGFHSLHIYGQTITGENIDFYDYAFIGVSSTDFDGDAVADSSEPCVYTIPSGLDADKDGQDNACDGVVDPLPAEPSPPQDNTTSDEQNNQSRDTTPDNNTPPANNDDLPEIIDNNDETAEQLPEILPGNNTSINSKPGNNNETQAGNEQIVNNSIRSSTTSQTQSINLVQNSAVASNRLLSDQEIPILEVSSSKDQSILGDNQARIVTQVSEIATNDFATSQPIKFYKKSIFYYTLSGLLLLVFLIIFGLRRRTGQRQI